MECGTAEHDIGPSLNRTELCQNTQLTEISVAVDVPAVLVAGGQGIMCSVACNETPELMPVAWSLANDLVACAVTMCRNQRSASPVHPLTPDKKMQGDVRNGEGQRRSDAETSLT